MITVLCVVAICLFFWAAVTDIAARRIPNRIVLAVASLGVMRVAHDVLSGGSLGAAASDFAMAFAALACGATLHHLRLLGGGDVKLLAAGVLWLGSGGSLAFIIQVAVAGGVLAAGFLVLIAIRRGQSRPSLPYGVAIAFGGIASTLAMT